jgi:hypothetical protein
MSTEPAALADDSGRRWLTPGVRGIGAASLLSDLGHEGPDRAAAKPAHLHPGRLTRDHGQRAAGQLALLLYTGHNLAAALASVSAGRLTDRRGPRLVLAGGVALFCSPTSALLPPGPASSCWPAALWPPGWRSAASRRPNTPRSRPPRQPAAWLSVRAAGRHPWAALDGRLPDDRLRLSGRLDGGLAHRTRRRWGAGPCQAVTRSLSNSPVGRQGAGRSGWPGWWRPPPAWRRRAWWP